jgi:hypothetical protein
VGLLLDNNNHISRYNARRLVRLAVELDLLARLHALVDVDLEDLALRNTFLPWQVLHRSWGP